MPHAGFDQFDGLARPYHLNINGEFTGVNDAQYVNRDAGHQLIAGEMAFHLGQYKSGGGSEVLLTRLPGTLGMQGRNELMFAEAHIECTGVRLARMAEVKILGNSHSASLPCPPAAWSASFRFEAAGAQRPSEHRRAQGPTAALAPITRQGDQRSRRHPTGTEAMTQRMSLGSRVHIGIRFTGSCSSACALNGAAGRHFRVPRVSIAVLSCLNGDPVCRLLGCSGKKCRCGHPQQALKLCAEGGLLIRTGSDYRDA